MNSLKEKACKKCRQIKPVEDYYENKYSPDGRYAFCKVCFDQFAKKLKEKELSAVPLNKKCVNCGKLRLIDEFDDQPDNPGTKDDWCNQCRKNNNHAVTQKSQKTDNKNKAETKPPKSGQPKPEESPPFENNSQKKEEPSLQNISQQPVQEITLEPDKSKSQKQPEKPKPSPTPEKAPELSEDFDFIEHLLETQALEKKMAYEALQVPKQITKIKTRKRTCNGCGKTEEIDQVEKNTVIPVHAWFCDYCRQKGVKRKLKKRMTVQDYWGREFKIKKIISNDLAMGVVKNHNGKWDKKRLKIYGNWKIH